MKAKFIFENIDMLSPKTKDDVFDELERRGHDWVDLHNFHEELLAQGIGSRLSADEEGPFIEMDDEYNMPSTIPQGFGHELMVIPIYSQKRTDGKVVKKKPVKYGLMYNTGAATPEYTGELDDFMIDQIKKRVNESLNVLQPKSEAEIDHIMKDLIYATDDTKIALDFQTYSDYVIPDGHVFRNKGAVELWGGTTKNIPKNLTFANGTSVIILECELHEDGHYKFENGGAPKKSFLPPSIRFRLLNDTDYLPLSVDLSNTKATTLVMHNGMVKNQDLSRFTRKIRVEDMKVDVFKDARNILPKYCEQIKFKGGYQGSIIDREIELTKY